LVPYIKRRLHDFYTFCSVADTVAEFPESISYAVPVFSRVLGMTLERVYLVFSCDHATIDILS
jgi:hypothetical protein